MGADVFIEHIIVRQDSFNDVVAPIGCERGFIPFVPADDLFAELFVAMIPSE